MLSVKKHGGIRLTKFLFEKSEKAFPHMCLIRKAVCFFVKAPKVSKLSKMYIDRKICRNYPRSWVVG